MLVMLIIRIFNCTVAETAMLRIVQWAFKVVWHIAGVRVTTIGFENVPDDDTVSLCRKPSELFSTSSSATAR